MEIVRDALRETRRLRRTFAIALGFALAVVVATVIGSRIAGVDVGDLTRDPLVVAGAPALTGFMSNLGVLLWSAAAGACLVPGLALRRRPETRPAARFFLASGALTALLVLDDVYQLHEEVVPGILGRGETVLIVTYVGLTAAYVLRYRRVLRAGEFPLLLVAGGAFAVSIGIDYIGLIGIEAEQLGDAGQLVEDGAKLAGIALWLAFYVRAAVAATAPEPAAPWPEGPAPERGPSAQQPPL